MRAAVAEQQLSADAELVARGVTAEVVVVVEEQDTRVVARLLAEEVRRGEPADAAAHHDQIIRLTRVSDGAGLLPKRAVPQRVRQLPRAVVAAAHAREGRRIVRGAILREQRRSLQRPATRREPRTGQAATDANHYPVQHIATADGPIQPEMPVFSIHRNAFEEAMSCGLYLSHPAGTARLSKSELI